MPSQSPFSAGLVARKVGIGILVVGIALGLITAATVFGSSHQPSLQKASEWNFAPPMPHRRSYTASAQIGGKVYVAAGMVGNTGRPLNIFERFDPAKGEWTSLPFVPAPFSAAAGAALGGKMYVIGGNGDPKDKAIDGRQVFAYDVATNKWSRKASLPKPRTNLAAVALGGKIYALGGLDPNHATDSVYVYDPKTNRWSIGPTLPEKLHALAAVVYQGGIWVIGGQDAAGQAVRRVWIYQPRAHSWHRGPSMPFRMETAGAAVADGELHVVLESKYLIYDPNARKWRRGPSLETPRHALAVYAVNGTLYAMGGCVTPQLEDSSVVEKLAL
jgi:N-acetylneuraminic acid mutarotase